MEKTVVIGQLHFKKNDMIGAVVKTRNIYNGLVQEHGTAQISYVDIWGGKNRAIAILFEIAKGFLRNKNIVLVSSAVDGPIINEILLLQKIYHRNLIYIPIGTRIAERIVEKPKAREKLTCITTFLPEIKENCDSLKNLGFADVELLRNFKSINAKDTPLKNISTDNKKYSFCTFSRVTSEKGIGDAINAIENASNELTFFDLRLDIYGVVDENYKKEFEELLKNSIHCEYKGIVDTKEAVSTLQMYDFLLFPTRFPEEGIPGTIIDAFAAGITIISSKWKYFGEILDDHKTAIGYEYKNIEAFEQAIVYAVTHIDEMNVIRRNAHAEYEKYDAKNVLPILSKHLV